MPVAGGKGRNRQRSHAPLPDHIQSRFFGTLRVNPLRVTQIEQSYSCRANPTLLINSSRSFAGSPGRRPGTPTSSNKEESPVADGVVMSPLAGGPDSLLSPPLESGVA